MQFPAKHSVSLAISVLFFLTSPAQGANCNGGTIDTSFGSSGTGFVQTSPLISGPANIGGLEGLALDSSGALISVDPTGWDSSGSAVPGLDRVLRTGSRDDTFGSVGFAVPTSVTTGGGTNVMVDSAGNTVMIATNPSTIQLFRFNAKGEMDPAFGIAGVATANIQVPFPIQKIRQQADGKYLVVATGQNPGASVPQQAVVVRFNGDGSLDTGFGPSGTGATYLFPNVPTSFNAFSRGADVMPLAGGAILVAGRYSAGGEGAVQSPFVAQLNTNGSINTSYGTSSGFTLPAFGSWAVARNMAVQIDGKVVLTGTQNNAGGPNTIPVWRVNIDGHLDSTFGTSGLQVISNPALVGGINGYAIVLQDNGKIVIGGVGFKDAAQNSAIGHLVRLLPNGQPDSTFGAGGFASIEVPNSREGSTGGNETLIDGQGKIIFKVNAGNVAPRIDGANYLVRIKTGSSKACR